LEDSFDAVNWLASGYKGRVGNCLTIVQNCPRIGCGPSAPRGALTAVKPTFLFTILLKTSDQAKKPTKGPFFAHIEASNRLTQRHIFSTRFSTAFGAAKTKGFSSRRPHLVGKFRRTANVREVISQAALAPSLDPARSVPIRHFPLGTETPIALHLRQRIQIQPRR
jgi:hypothetical protein